MAPALKQGSIERRQFVAQLLKVCPDALVVTGLGSPSYDVFAAGDRKENFYLWGAMGGAAAMGLGLALAQPTRHVLVITGDGEQLMGLGALATIGVQQPNNMTVVVLDNGHFGETGMQRSHSSLGVDLSAIARACDFKHVMRVEDMAGAASIADCVNAASGCTFAQVMVAADELARALPPRDGVYLKNRFRETLALFPM